MLVLFEDFFGEQVSRTTFSPGCLALADAGLFAPILLVSRVSLSLHRQQPQKTFPTCIHALRNLISATAAVPDTAAPLASRADSSTARTAARATAAPHEGCRNNNGAGESQGGTGETHREHSKLLGFCRYHARLLLLCWSVCVLSTCE